MLRIPTIIGTKTIAPYKIADIHVEAHYHYRGIPQEESVLPPAILLDGMRVEAKVLSFLHLVVVR
ncbi:hypothetical protein [Actinotignum urinale]|uniref:hypothetical protein n=1 Tax=Actinotignum urinale TaxID=190146 RepID=UPI000406F964|nr:hypothetical protein [Actinotignum urinale]